MDDLSLHILDVVENSIEADARNIIIQIWEDSKADKLTIEISDDGRGMDEATLQKVLDPFYTTRKVRRVGLGLSFLQQAAQLANGDLSIHSQVGQGTTVKATFQHSHIDRKPLGDMAKTLITLVIGHPNIRFRYAHQKNGQKGEIDTRELVKAGEASSLSIVELVDWIKRHFPMFT